LAPFLPVKPRRRFLAAISGCKVFGDILIEDNVFIDPYYIADVSVSSADRVFFRHDTVRRNRPPVVTAKSTNVFSCPTNEGAIPANCTLIP
jgi:hypothetical protein